MGSGGVVQTVLTIWRKVSKMQGGEKRRKDVRKENIMQVRNFKKILELNYI